jgi:hypothetical protein
VSWYKRARDGHGGDRILGVARLKDTDGNLAIVGGIRGVNCPASIIEADLATDAFLQFSL